MTKISMILGYGVALAAGAFGAPNKGTLYEKDSNKSKVLYQWTQVIKQNGTQKIAHITFTDPEAKVAAEEDSIVENGKLLRYEVHHKQLGEEGLMEVKDGKVIFSYTKNGKTEKSEEDLEDNFVAGPTLVDYLAARKAILLKGDTVKIRFAVLDRKETVGFQFFKVGEEKFEGKDAVVIKMKPSSFVIAALVDPLFFTFTKDDMRIRRIVGRTLPKQKIDGKWKDLDADIWYF